MAHKFASEQPEDVQNFIEKVAIVGVSHGLIFLASVSIQHGTEAADRRAVKSANSSQKSYSKLGSIKSPQLLV